MSELEGAFNANVPFMSNSINLIYHTWQIREFEAELNEFTNTFDTKLKI